MFSRGLKIKFRNIDKQEKLLKTLKVSKVTKQLKYNDIVTGMGRFDTALPCHNFNVRGCP